MIYTDIEKLGFRTIATDTNSFVSRTTEEDIWLEVFYCNEKDYLQIMRGIRGSGGETIRENILEGKGDIEVIRQFLK